MATWVTQLMIADSVLKHFPKLDRRGFCVGRIAPDCNVENEDWTAFTPPKEVTHCMQGQRKDAADCDAFYREFCLFGMCSVFLCCRGHHVGSSGNRSANWQP